MSPDQLKSIRSELATLAKSKKSAVRAGVAASPFSSADTLQSLGKDKNASVRQKLAGNPNTPTDILTALSKSSSSFLKELVAKNPSTPVATLMSLAKITASYTSLQCDLAQNKNASTEVLQAIITNLDKWMDGTAYHSYERLMRSSVIAHPNTTPELRKKLLDKVDSCTKQEAAESLLATADTLRLLAKDKNVGRTLVRNPNCPKDLLGALLAKLSNSEKLALIRDADDTDDAFKFSPELLELLLKDDDAEVKIMALEHASKLGDIPTIAPAVSAKPESKYIPPPMDVILTKDDVLKELLVSGNKGLLEGVLLEQAESAKNPAVLAELGKDPSAKIRSRLCQNDLVRDAYSPELEDIAMHLAEDADAGVIESLRMYTRNAKVLAALATSSDVKMRRMVASDSYTSEETRQILARDPDPEVRLNAAKKIGHVPTRTAPQEAIKPTSSYAVPAILGAAGLASFVMNSIAAASVPGVRVAVPTLAETVAEATEQMEMSA